MVHGLGYGVGFRFRVYVYGLLFMVSGLCRYAYGFEHVTAIYNYVVNAHPYYALVRTVDILQGFGVRVYNSWVMVYGLWFG